MKNDLLDSITDYMSEFKDDAIASELLVKLGHHLDSKNIERRINETAAKVFDFANPPEPIFSSLSEPKTFVDGFKDAADVVAFFFNVFHHAEGMNKDKAFLKEHLMKAIEQAETPKYTPFFQNAVRKKSEDDCNDVLRLSTSLRRTDIEAAISVLRDDVLNQRALVNSFDETTIVEAEAALNSQIAEIDGMIELYKLTNEVPSNLVIAPIFKDYPVDQLLFNKETLRAELTRLRAKSGSEITALHRMENNLATLIAERASLDRLSQLPSDKKVAA